MAKPQPRDLEVLRCEYVTPNMRRITLGGSGLEGFPPEQDSAYIKLFLGDSKLGKKPLMRTYTIRAQREQDNEVDIDFVIHGDEGPASVFAMQAKVGDPVTIAGPGPVKLVDMSADWFFIIGDMTALPAASVSVENLPANARGYAVFEVLTEADRQDLPCHENFQIHWVINPHPDKENSCLVDKVTALPWLDGRPSVWAACEFTGMRALRKYFKQDRQVGKEEIYVSSYWKRGLSEDQHKKVKQLDLA